MGALTLKTFSDELREWEFIEADGVDPMDSFGANLKLSIRENQIFLVEPNDPFLPWITNKGRLFFEGMFNKNLMNNFLNWENKFETIFNLLYFLDHLNLKRKKIFSFIFALENVSLEILNMLYLLSQKYAFIQLRKVENYKINNDLESKYLLNDSVKKPKLNFSNFVIILNTNPRYEGYILNLNLRQRFLKGNLKLFTLGPMLELTFPTRALGSNFSILKFIGEGTNLTCQDLKNSKFPIFITNTELFKRSDFTNFIKIFKHINIINKAWNGINILHSSLSSVGVNSLNMLLPLLYKDFVNFFGFYFINVLLNSNSNFKKLIELQLLKVFSENTKINYKFFIDQNNFSVNENILTKIGVQSKIYDNYFYLPNNLFLEDNETYINTEGLIKRTTKLISFKKEAKNNWQIIRKIYANLKQNLFLNNRKNNELISFDCINLFNFKNYINFQFYATQTLTSLSFYLTKQNKPLIKSNTSLKITKIKLFHTKLKLWLDDFFFNEKDLFSYNSSSLSNCSKTIRISSTNFF